MKLALFLLPCALFAQPAPCPLSVTNGTSTICLVGPPGPTGPQGVPGPTGPAGAQGPAGPAGAGIPTIKVLPSGDTQVTGNLIVTGSVTTGAPGVPTVWNIVRSDGKACTADFRPTNPAGNTTTIVINCP